MPRFISTLVFLMIRCFIVTSSSCQSDRNQDHRPRVSCVSQGLTAVPAGIDADTQVLVLTGNQFTSLSWSMYSGFSELLMEIYLDRNQIRSLHDSTFSELPRLEVINLSENKLPALPPRLLERVSSGGLKTFDLENNSVSLMPDGFFSSKPELPYVYLTHNPWLCSCAVGYLHSYLNDQEHNVYMHDGPNDIVPAADSVVCSGPPHLMTSVHQIQWILHSLIPEGTKMPNPLVFFQISNSLMFFQQTQRAGKCSGRRCTE
uniref:Platelet glycoprotein Ib alpha chain-like n=1 Tax=Sinocyclocheilus grahami TaxID=75366 RepID=A0A672K846_SINGR